jgi:hypothetical protein
VETDRGNLGQLECPQAADSTNGAALVLVNLHSKRELSTVTKKVPVTGPVLHEVQAVRVARRPRKTECANI